jgi:hypothetical protein
MPVSVSLKFHKLAGKFSISVCFTVSHFFVVGSENSCSDAAFRREVLKCFTVTR